MRIIIASLVLFLQIHLVFGQVKPSKTQKPVRNEMQVQMSEAVNELNKQISDLDKQLTEAKKNKEDEATIKDLEDQLTLLKKQVAMMGSLKKNISGISEKTFQKVGEEEAIVPKKDVIRISMLRKNILTETELLLFIKNVHAQVDKMIPVEEKVEAIKIYDETKAEYKSVAVTANAASGCWMLGHWEKALYIMGRACMDDITDADNLNNYASFLISTGAEQAALPILQYLDSKYPKNSTIKNNIGQAWFGLGDMDNAKKNLDETTILYPGHSMANATLSNIYQAEGDNENAISFLKASLKETYDPDKEAQLANLGYNIKFADMPPFNYPLQKDPLGIISIIQSLPENYPSRIGDDKKTSAINRYVNGIKDLLGILNDEDEVLKTKNRNRELKLSSNSTYREEFLPPHNNPAYKQALRSRELIVEEKLVGSSAINEVKTGLEVREECMEIWENNVVKPIADLAFALNASISGKNCSSVDAAINAYEAKKAEIRKNGTILIKQLVMANAEVIDKWIKINLYSTKDDPPTDNDQRTLDLISNMDFTIGRKKYKNGEVYNFLDLANKIVEKQGKIKSSCDYSSTSSEDGNDPLAHLIYRNLKCEFKKVFTTPIVVYSFECNTIKEKSKRNLKPKKDPVKKGQVRSSNSSNQTRNQGPLNIRPSGPSKFSYEIDEKEITNQKTGPLNAEYKDLSQCSIEYDRWGNLIGFNFQLNKEGTGLADPDLNESRVDGRWSWNAAGSTKKGFLNKLLIK